MRYDVCFSFAGEDRPYVEKVAAALTRRGLRVFYDGYETVSLWGKDLYQHLADIYTRQARYCVIFASAAYARKAWPRHELASAQARALSETREYILPARFDDTEIPGLLPSTGYIDLRNRPPEEVSDLIFAKVAVEGTSIHSQPLPMPSEGKRRLARRPTLEIPFPPPDNLPLSWDELPAIEGLSTAAVRVFKAFGDIACKNMRVTLLSLDEVWNYVGRQLRLRQQLDSSIRQLMTLGYLEASAAAGAFNLTEAGLDTAMQMFTHDNAAYQAIGRLLVDGSIIDTYELDEDLEMPLLVIHYTVMQFAAKRYIDVRIDADGYITVVKVSDTLKRLVLDWDKRMP